MPKIGREQWVKLGWLTIFGIAMAYLEAAVVVYLRQMFYPQGFVILSLESLRPMPPFTFAIELGREAATIVMLAALSIAVSRRNWWERFAFFIWSFGIWDIFYYVWLYATLRWPSSPLTTDILFLIPVPWLGPVIAPVLVSITMLIFAVAILRMRTEAQGGISVWRHWVYMVLGAWLIFSSFTIAHYGETANLWNDLACGLLVGILALSALIAGKDQVREDQRTNEPEK